MKVRFLFALIILTVSIFLIVCDSDNPTHYGTPPDLTGDIVSIDIGQAASIDAGAIEIGFDSVLIEDRCALGSPDDCFYGHASSRFWLYQPNADTIWLTLNLTGGDSLFGSGNLISVDTAGLLLTMISLEPHPRLGKTINYDEYRAGLIVTDNFASDSTGASLIPTNMSRAFVRMDEYDLDSAWIDTDSLTVQVRHGGGCRKHYYQLFMNPDAFAESLPVQADLYLRHFNNIDFCRAYVLARPTFDLSLLKERYFELYDVADSATVLLNIHDYMDGSGNDIQLPYHFTR